MCVFVCVHIDITGGKHARVVQDGVKPLRTDMQWSRCN
jgi:hypothetical protein